MKKQHIYLLLTVLVIIMAACSKDDEILEPAKSSAKQITGFVFKAVNNDAITEDVTAVINETNKTISATVANGTDIKSLTPAIVVSDKASAGQSGAKDFSSPVGYTITAEDGTSATYEVTVTIALNSTKQILSFAFKKEDNQLYGDETITATIDEANKTITATVSYSANVALLTPSIVVSSNASVSPDIALDFSNPVAYTITAEDGTTTSYQVILEITFTDRDALIAIYNANPNNTLPWNLEDPDITNWRGISVDENNNIIGLHLQKERDGEGTIGYSLTTIPEEISKLSFLAYLDLGGNEFTDIPLAVLQLKNLTSLYADHNNITSISNEIGKLENLSLLVLYSNKIKFLPSGIGKLKRLTRLSLYFNNLTELPKEIGELINLEDIYIYGNELIDLPAEFAQLTKIRNLSLSFNRFTELPKEIGLFNFLTALDLRFNHLKLIPSEIEQLSNLLRLDLSENDLATIPEEIGGLASLTSLILSRNELTSIPLELGNLTSLTSLLINDNQLTSIPKEIGNLTSLRSLHLDANLLTSIPQEVCKLEDTGTRIRLDPGVKCE